MVLDRRRERVEPDRIVAGLQRPLDGARRIVRGDRAERPAIGVAAHLPAVAPAQQLIDRHAEGAALDVPQCGLDRADGGKDDQTAALRPERVVVHVAPEQIGLERIAVPNDRADHLLQHADRALGAAAVGQGCLSKARDSLVGPEAEDQRASSFDAGEAELHTGDLHAGLSWFYVPAIYATRPSSPSDLGLRRTLIA
jgi:hypothetical protein